MNLVSRLLPLTHVLLGLEAPPEELAAAFHGLWNKGKDDSGLRFIMSDAPELTMARLALVQAVAFALDSPPPDVSELQRDVLAETEAA